MAKTRTTKKALLSSVLSLVLCCAMLIGTTFAWFTDSVTSANNIITVGNLDIGVYYATPADVVDGDIPADAWKPVTSESIFNKDALWEPGYTEALFFKFDNEGSLALQYRFAVDILDETPGKNVDGNEFMLSDHINAYICNNFQWNYRQFLFTDRDSATNPVGAPDPFYDTLYNAANAGVNRADNYTENQLSLDSWQWLDPTETTYATMVLWMPETVGNEVNHNGTDVPKINLGISVFATQYTYENDSFGNDYDKEATIPDTWNGQPDIEWFTADPDAEEFTIDSAEALAGLSELVNNGKDTRALANSRALIPENFDYSFDGKAFTLNTDIDLSGKNFMPIGGVDKGEAFQGTFDGNGHTIYGLTQSGWDLGYYYGQSAGMGLFGWVGDATIKNLTMDGTEISMEAVVMGAVAGYAGGDCTFDNITVKNSKIANYNWDTGGIVGQVYGTDSTFVFKNITIDSTTTISGHWGTWDVSAGGVIGRTADGVKVTMENVTVACVLDVFNDACAAYQWFAYRYSGMLVGYTKTTRVNENGSTVATADHVECKNVTVIYGDWMNYTYCQPSNVAPQYVRVQGGYSTDPYYSGRHWTAGVDAAGNKMVDDNHVHADGQAHNVVLAFDQLFGGGQGVYGTATHNGVTVIYPASYNPEA